MSAADFNNGMATAAVVDAWRNLGSDDGSSAVAAETEKAIGWMQYARRMERVVEQQKEELARLAEESKKNKRDSESRIYRLSQDNEILRGHVQRLSDDKDRIYEDMKKASIVAHATSDVVKEMAQEIQKCGHTENHSVKPREVFEQSKARHTKEWEEKESAVGYKKPNQ